MVEASASGTVPDGARVASSPEDLVAILPPNERRQLEECEEILHRSPGTFCDVGNALLTIREKRLYRSTHSTFDHYCRERLDIGRTYAWRVISATERLNRLPQEGNLPKPCNEFQMRPFLKLQPREFPRVWEQVTQRAKDGKITNALVQAIVRELKPKAFAALRSADGKSAKRRMSGSELGQVLTLLQAARKCVENHQCDEVLEVLEKLEQLFFQAQG